MGGAISIRGAAMGDTAALARLSTELGYRSSPEEVARRLEAIERSGGDVALVALDDAAGVVGFIHLALARRVESDPFVEIGGLVVAEAAQRRGVGRALVAAGEAWARGRGVPRIRVRSRDDRVAAHRFYQNLGYAATKTQQVFGKELGGAPAGAPPRA